MINDFLIDHWKLDGCHATREELDCDRIEEGHWYYCQRGDNNLAQWLLNNDIDSGIVDALLADDTRPRFELYDDGSFLLILRGINFSADSAPEDMLSIRVLYTHNTIISTRKIPSKALTSLREALSTKEGPKSIDGVIIHIIDMLNKYIEQYLDELEPLLDEGFDDPSCTRNIMELNSSLHKVKRFIKPQKYALEDCLKALPTILDDKEYHLRNSVDTIIRINETIDFYLSQVQLIQSNFHQIQMEKTNQNTYLFSVITALFIPITFVTGLFGINVGGIPGSEHPFAFLAMSCTLLLVFCIEFLILKKLKFIGDNT